MPKFKRKLPSGRVVARFKRGKTRAAKCAKCGKPLHGMPRLHQADMRKLAKTEKRPERAFGGFYCSACTRELFREKARGMV